MQEALVGGGGVRASEERGDEVLCTTRAQSCRRPFRDWGVPFSTVSHGERMMVILGVGGSQTLTPQPFPTSETETLGSF